MAIAVEQLGIQRALGLGISISPRRVEGTLPAPEPLAFVVQPSGDDECVNVCLRDVEGFGGLPHAQHDLSPMVENRLLARRKRPTIFILGLIDTLIDDEPATYVVV